MQQNSIPAEPLAACATNNTPRPWTGSVPGWFRVASISVLVLAAAGVCGPAGWGASLPDSDFTNPLLRQLRFLLQTLVTGNLLLAALAIGGDVWAAARWPGDTGFRVAALVALVLAMAVVSLFVVTRRVQPEGGEALAVFLFLALPTLIIATSLLWLAALRLRSVVGAWVMLAVFVAASALGQRCVVGSPGIGIEERALLVNSSLITLAIFTALAAWLVREKVPAHE
jgi:hypothetical protein